MKIQGTFKTYDNGQKYKIEIGTGNTINNITDPIELGPQGPQAQDVIMFDADPVTITCDRGDLNKRIIISQAQINLISNMDLTDILFVPQNVQIPVRITEVSDENDAKHVWFGFVDPLQFDQGYAHNYEQISVTATDPLGALEGYTIDKIPGMTSATQMSPYNLMLAILNKAGIYTGQNNDNTIIINQEVLRCMQNTQLQCSIFFGEDKDDYKTLYDVLETICKYFNLYIAMKGEQDVIITCTVNNDYSQSEVSLAPFKNKATDTSTSISMDDVYTRIQLTCNIDPQEGLIDSITDKDKIYSDYDNPQHYMTEYSAEMDRDHTAAIAPWWGFYDILNGNTPSYDKCYASENFVQVLRNDAWDFGEIPLGTQGPQGYTSYINYMGGDYNRETGQKTRMDQSKNQYDLLYWLAEEKGRAALLGFQKYDKVNLKVITDDTPQNPDTKTYLVISTMGNKDSSQATIQGYQTAIQNHAPICKYTELNSRILSPSDANTINYIVVSGSIILNPLQGLTGRQTTPVSANLANTWDDTKDYWKTEEQVIDPNAEYSYTAGYYAGKGYTLGNGNEWMYYQQKWDKGTQARGGIRTFLNNSAAKDLQYLWSSPGNQSDKISKMPILSCELKVGEGTTAKYCIEELWRGEAGINSFVWMTLDEMIAKQVEIFNNTGKVYNIHDNPIFTIGINIKNGDYIIGQEYKISASQNLGIKVDGMAIPIKMADGLTGTVSFKILGPYNATFEDVTSEKHIVLYGPSYNSWGYYWTGETTTKSVLSYTHSIMVGDLKIETTSNNGGISELRTTQDNDLVYYSDINPQYLEIDDEDIDICTALTNDECINWGIKIQQSDSYVYWMPQGQQGAQPFYGFQGSQGTVKPEQCLIDYLYKEYCQIPAGMQTPSRILSTQLKSDALENGIYGNALNIDMLENYYVGLPININARIMSYETDLKYKTVNVKFRQHNTTTNVQI